LQAPACARHRDGSVWRWQGIGKAFLWTPAFGIAE
jgi:hypothetical protein